MKISEYVQLVEKAFRAKKRVLAVGAPGVGKTYGAMEACDHIGAQFIGICSPLEDPSTIRGYPSRGADGTATHCLFDGIARAMAATEPTLLFFDDLGMASESTMRAIVRLIQFGEIDNRRLPDCVVIGAATNDVTHASGVYGMIEPLKSRFHTIVQVETNLDDVVAWGLAHGWPNWLCAYLRACPDALHDWKPCKSMKVDGSCPRGLDYVAQWDNSGIDDPEVWAGCIGRGRATQAHSYKQLMDQLPDIMGIIMDPENAPIPESPDARWLVSVTLSAHMTAGNFAACVTYLQRMPGPFRAYSIRDAFRAEQQKRKDNLLPKDYRPLTSSRDFTAWSVSPDGKEIMSMTS